MSEGSSSADGRMAPLDYLRGGAVAGMIVVTSPGDWNNTYAPLLHAAWNGWTPADMVFPTFLFAVGVALALSFPRPLSAAGEAKIFWMRLLRRVVALIALGLALNWAYVLAIGAGAGFLGEAGLGHIRLPGVPQRIALCYGLAAILIVFTGTRTRDDRTQINGVAQAIAIASILLGYWALITLTPVPGHGAGRLEPDGSLPGFVDLAVFGSAHLWPLGAARWGDPATYDPEGLLSTLPATTNVLWGVLAVRLLQADPTKAPLRLTVAGLILILAGLCLNPVFVINKRLWTSSFALLSSGVSAMAFAVFITLARSRIARWMMTPLEVLGRNAITAFTLSILLGLVYSFPLFGADDQRLSPQSVANAMVLQWVTEPRLASLICALAMLGVILAALWPLYRKGVNIRL